MTSFIKSILSKHININSNENEYFLQIIDEYSFNLKNYTEIHKFYNNFERKGETTAYKDNIKLSPKINNTFGLFYTKHVSIN